MKGLTILLHTLRSSKPSPSLEEQHELPRLGILVLWKRPTYDPSLDPSQGRGFHALPVTSQSLVSPVAQRPEMQVLLEVLDGPVSRAQGWSIGWDRFPKPPGEQQIDNTPFLHPQEWEHVQ